VISRKDIEHFEIRHLLHSLSIAKIVSFLPSTRILDVGTGGGFPGIPLAILLPDAEFTLLDSIAKKIRVAASVASELGLKNVITKVSRAEEEKGKYDFVISRAVTSFNDFVDLTKKNIIKGGINTLPNGLICLKGGDLKDELKRYRNEVRIWNISDFFSQPFFATKKIVFLQKF
jgi:16S rRNA (guanine527-N7)-methyltransferase